MAELITEQRKIILAILRVKSKVVTNILGLTTEIAMKRKKKSIERLSDIQW